MNNYHWYLKQSIEFAGSGDMPACVLWDVIDGTVLYILCINGSLRRYSIDWVTNTNTFTSSDHETAVIDGSKYTCTCLGIKNVAYLTVNNVSNATDFGNLGFRESGNGIPAVSWNPKLIRINV